MAESAIEWTDATWNPTVGCTRASAGCDNCYAVKMSNRLDLMGQKKYEGLTSVNGRGDRHFNGVVRTVESDLLLPLRWKKPRKVFVNSMSDLFHKEVPFEYIDKVFAVMALCPHHTFQILTKRPDRMAEYFAPNGRGISFTEEQNRQLDNYFPEAPETWYDAASDREVATLIPGWWDRLNKVEGFGDVAPPNVWLGTSTEDQKTADERIPHLLRCPAAVRFLSCEPLIGPVLLENYVEGHAPMLDRSYLRDTFNPLTGERIHTRVDWVIAGCESGPNRRTCELDWVGSLVNQCTEAGVPVFVKQLQMVGTRRVSHEMSEWPPDLRIREFPVVKESLTVAEVAG